jgi:hypothetical protein
MLMGKRIYLLDTQRNRVFYSQSLFRLMEGAYCLSNN